MREREELRITLRVFWSEQLEGWRCHQLRWRGLGQKAQELSWEQVEMGMSTVLQVLMSNRQLDIQVWSSRESGLGGDINVSVCFKCYLYSTRLHVLTTGESMNRAETGMKN